MQILAVHDRRGVLETIAKTLKYIGHDVFITDSGQKVLTILKKRKKEGKLQIDVIISHIKLPDKDTTKMLKEIKKISSDIYVFFITAYVGKDEMNIFLRLLEQGAYDCRIFHVQIFEEELKFILRKIKKEKKLKEMLKKIGAREEDVAILFADLEGFTKYANENRDRPEEVGYELNECLSCMSEATLEANGDIDKYLGDGLLAVFRNLDIDNTYENLIKRAIYSSINMQKKLQGGKFKVNIGINIGKVLVGVFGSERRKEYTVIGSPVNFASRLQDEAKGGQILISEKVFEKLGGIGDSFTRTLKIEGEKITCQIKKLKNKKLIKGIGKVWIYEITNY